MVKKELRLAIWLAYDKRDVYSKKLIENFDDLEIDHIIPRSISADLLKERIINYCLGKDFNVHSIENLVPTFKIHNRQKSDMIFNESNERFFLSIAASNKAKVENELGRIIKNNKTKAKRPFGEKREVIDAIFYGSNPSYFYSKTFVSITAYLPSKFGQLGSCNIEFYEFGSMVSFGHEAILTLVDAVKGSTLERCISYYYNNKSDSGFIKLGDTSIHLKKDAYYQLLTILNDFLIVYEDYNIKYEQFFGIARFPKTDSGEFFLLKQIKEDDWRFLLKYCSHHHETNPVGNEFHFTYHANCLIALCVDDSKETIVSFSVYPGSVDGSPDKVKLLWELPTLRQRKFIENGKVWTADRTANWLDHALSNKQETRISRGKSLLKRFSFLKLG
jgi:hypothetical protein